MYSERKSRGRWERKVNALLAFERRTRTGSGERQGRQVGFRGSQQPVMRRPHAVTCRHVSLFAHSSRDTLALLILHTSMDSRCGVNDSVLYKRVDVGDQKTCLGKKEFDREEDKKREIICPFE